MKEIISHKEVSLPTDLPRPCLNLSSDAASEDLLRQNHDLMARLATSLRRSAELETQIKSLTEKILFLKEQNQSISDASLTNRQLLEQGKEEVSTWRNKVKELEIAYAKIYSLHQGDVDSYTKENTHLKNELARYKKFRKIVKTKVRAFIRSLQAKIYLLEKNILEKDKEIHIKSYKASSLEKQIIGIHKDYQSERMRLKEEWNTRMDHMEEILSESENYKAHLQNKIDKLESRLKTLQNLDDEYSLAKNRALSSERERLNLERKFEHEIRSMQSKILELKEKNQSLTFQLKTEKEKNKDWYSEISDSLS